ncbi:hypothetical protein Q7P36_008818 [Cladosporium allicinum]
MSTLEVVAVPFNSLTTPTQLEKLACPPPTPTNHQQDKNKIHPNEVRNRSECSSFRLGSQGSFTIDVGGEAKEIAVIKRIGTPYSQSATTREVTSGKNKRAARPTASSASRAAIHQHTERERTNLSKCNRAANELNLRVSKEKRSGRRDEFVLESWKRARLFCNLRRNPFPPSTRGHEFDDQQRFERASATRQAAIITPTPIEYVVLTWTPATERKGPIAIQCEHAARRVHNTLTVTTELLTKVTHHVRQQALARADHRPEPGRCFLHNRDQNIPDQVRHHTIGAVNELGVSGKEDSSGSRAQITKSHRRGKEHRARVSLLQTSYLGRNSLPAISVVSEFSHDRSQLTAVNTLAPRICTRTLLIVVIAGNTDIAFLMTHADGGMNLRVRGARGSVALPVCSELALSSLLVHTAQAGPGLSMSDQDQRELACRNEPLDILFLAAAVQLLLTGEGHSMERLCRAIASLKTCFLLFCHHQ